MIAVVLPLVVLVLVLLVVLPIVGAAVSSIVGTLLSGLVVGALGRLVVPGRQPLGCFVTSLVGIAGSLLGALLAQRLHAGRLGTFVLEVAAAALLVVLMVRLRLRPGFGRPSGSLPRRR